MNNWKIAVCWQLSTGPTLSGGDWSVASNWLDEFSVSRLPGPADDVVINIGGAATVTHSQNVTDYIHSLSANNAIVLSSGVIDVATTLASAGTFTVKGGTLREATVSSGTTISVAYPGATLDAVNLAAGSELAIVSGDGNLTSANVVNGLTVDGHVSLGYIGQL